MLCHFSDRQVPCAVCQGDALPIGAKASDFGIFCAACDCVTCRECARFEISPGLNGLRCPRCAKPGTPMFLHQQPSAGA